MNWRFYRKDCRSNFRISCSSLLSESFHLSRDGRQQILGFLPDRSKNLSSDSFTKAMGNSAIAHPDKLSISRLLKLPMLEMSPDNIHLLRSRVRRLLRCWSEVGKTNSRGRLAVKSKTQSGGSMLRMFDGMSTVDGFELYFLLLLCCACNSCPSHGDNVCRLYLQLRQSLATSVPLPAWLQLLLTTGLLIPQFSHHHV
ncbi:hypothetical protein Cgig2_029335 [Carnegiea gigantea]|uniref:Uncharacterized protein n=1 Tax=Carnegiea gigantea TaxID=171969 RepID=A0A9Q1KW41_9CARY|nr:hypothetical protein Cgig2_029335 [Carnegiea gigantea]